MGNVDGERLALWAADPTQKLKRVVVALSGAFGGDGCVADGDQSVVTIDFPQDEWAGKTVCVTLKRL